VRLLAEELRKELSSAQEGGDARQREEGIMLPSPTYSLALSTALMVTALRDVMTVRHMLNGAPVFSGGDDDLALLPIETGLAAVDILRGLYHGENGFHRIGDYFIPAPVVYGKSFSLRVANILDLMSDEIAESARLLDEVAKKTVWSHSAGETKKDSLVLSDSRSGAVALLPLGDGHRALKALELMWLSRLCGFLSANLPEDFQRLSDAVERAAETGSWDTALKLLGYTLERNVSRDPRGKDLLDGLQRLLEELAQQGWRSHGNSERRSALSRLVESFRVVRGYP
jgi:CRISPR-associated protein Cmr2